MAYRGEEEERERAIKTGWSTTSSREGNETFQYSTSNVKYRMSNVEKQENIKNKMRIGLLGSVMYVALEVAYIAEKEGPHNRPLLYSLTMYNFLGFYHLA